MDEQKPPKPKKINPTPKQRLFAAKMLEEGKTKTQSFIETYRPKNQKNVYNLAHVAAKRPGVQYSIQEIIERICPHIGDTAVTYLQEILVDPMRSDMVKLKALDQLTKWMGWSTTKVESKTLHATVDLGKQYALPESGSEEPEPEEEQPEVIPTPEEPK